MPVAREIKFGVPIIMSIVSLLSFSCSDKYKDDCSNPDAVNYEPLGRSEQNCIYPGDYVVGAYGCRVTEYPLQPDQIGTTHSFDIRESYCYGPEKSYKYVQFFSLQSPFGPSDFCLLLNGYNFEFTEQMQITWAGAKLTGTGSFSANGDFQFSGTIHRLNGTEFPITLKGGK